MWSSKQAPSLEQTRAKPVQGQRQACGNPCWTGNILPPHLLGLGCHEGLGMRGRRTKAFCEDALGLLRALGSALCRAGSGEPQISPRYNYLLDCLNVASMERELMGIRESEFESLTWGFLSGITGPTQQHLHSQTLSLGGSWHQGPDCWLG